MRKITGYLSILVEITRLFSSSWKSVLRRGWWHMFPVAWIPSWTLRNSWQWHWVQKTKLNRKEQKCNRSGQKTTNRFVLRRIWAYSMQDMVTGLISFIAESIRPEALRNPEGQALTAAENPKGRRSGATKNRYIYSMEDSEISNSSSIPCHTTTPHQGSSAFTIIFSENFHVKSLENDIWINRGRISI